MNNLHYHDYAVKTLDKTRKNGHKSGVVWLTGLSGSGKSTIANILENKLFELDCQTHILDGDNVRMGLNSDLGFSPDERKENIRRIAEVSNLFAESGTIVITAFISPYTEDRAAAKAISKHQFVEVFVDTPLEVCEERDPKGLYKKARAGIIPEFTGVTAPYEEPGDETLRLNTRFMTADECAEVILEELDMLGLVRER